MVDVFFLNIHFSFAIPIGINKGERCAKCVVASWIRYSPRHATDQEKSTCRFIRLMYRGSNRENNHGDSSNIAVSSLPSRASRAISLFHFVNLQWRDPFSKSNIFSRDDSNVQFPRVSWTISYSTICFYWLVINIFVRKLVSYI